MTTPLYIGKSDTGSAPSYDEIAVCAYQLWSDSGHPEGRDDEIWLEAEHRLMITASQPPNVTAAILQTLRQPVAHPGGKSDFLPTASR